MAPEIKHLKESSSLQRGGLNHQAIEDYLKTIYTLAQIETPVSTSRIATAREVKPASVTGMIKRLSKLQLVNYEKHYGVTLTDSGRQIALEVIRHHRLIELYLIEALGFSWDEVHEQADILEHVISEKLEERIAAALNYPQFDPHGDPIPTKDGQMHRLDTILLTQVAPNTNVRIARILDSDNSDLLRYLADLGLKPGAKLTVNQIEPFDGPLTLTINDETRVVGFNVASNIRVEKI
ncbi:MAG TPA: metal-dependent transcriptional regulator [Anaerolineae bacterium]|nr:metal-dependent transcriptional regulator [Anaerolineae bacterium]